MSDSSSNNKRIAKNTLLLYFRMGITMLVQLYTSRVVLANLGVEDYGIYNVVGSFIVAFTFISGPLGSATQRFLNFELGRKEEGNVNLIFNLSFYTYMVLAFALFIIIEVAGLWFIHNKMQLPEGRLDAALFVFQMSAVSLIFNLLQTPFNALLISHEKMSYYAYISIVEVSLKLLNAISLSYFAFDKLNLYAVNHLLISIVIASCMWIYCSKHFSNIKLQRMWNKDKFNEMMSFSGWSLFGSVANMSANQGLNILLNTFFGVVVNAATGIASQVSAAVNQFVNNFQIAYRPQLVKYYAAGEIDELNNLICNTAKYSYLLLFALVCPICFNIDFILKIWLKNPPEYAGEFCVFMLIFILLETMSAPMWMTVQATGKIKRYQLIISSAIFLNILFSYFLLCLKCNPYSVWIVKCVLDVVCLLIRICFIRRLVNFSPYVYLRKTLVPIVVVTSASLLVETIVFFCLNGTSQFLFSLLFFYLVYSLVIIFYILDMSDKSRLILFVKSTF